MHGHANIKYIHPVLITKENQMEINFTTMNELKDPNREIPSGNEKFGSFRQV